MRVSLVASLERLEDLGAVARDADRAGLDTLWLPDHLMQVTPGAPPTDPVPEAYTALGFLAAHTTRIRLGTMVAAVTFRPAALLVKAVTTLDVLSGGRAWLGVGAGYQTDEARALGLPMPPRAERFAVLDETLGLARRLWAGDRTPFRGEHLRLDDPVASPPPATRPRPPILVGGTGPRRTLPLVARHADAANFFDVPDGGASLRAAGDALDRCCAEIGRDPASVERTVSTRLGEGESAAAFTDRAAALGADHVVVLSGRPWTPAALEVLAEARSLLGSVTTARSA